MSAFFILKLRAKLAGSEPDRRIDYRNPVSIFAVGRLTLAASTLAFRNARTPRPRPFQHPGSPARICLAGLADAPGPFGMLVRTRLEAPENSQRRPGRACTAGLTR